MRLPIASRFNLGFRWPRSAPAIDASLRQPEPKSRVTPVPSPSDIELFARIRAGDPEAFAAFYDRHAPLLYGIALRILGNEPDAEDLLQEAAVMIWERAPQHRSDSGHPLAWAVTLTRNRAIDRLRAARRRAEKTADAGEEPEAATLAGPSAPERAMDAEAAEAVHSALASLALEQRHAIELAFFNGFTQQEISERLGQPLGTIKARIRRGMMTLRDALEGRL